MVRTGCPPKLAGVVILRIRVRISGVHAALVGAGVGEAGSTRKS